jgi:hypothetical protein
MNPRGDGEEGTEATHYSEEVPEDGEERRGRTFLHSVFREWLEDLL